MDYYKPNLGKINRLKANFPRDLQSETFLPTTKEEETIIEILKKKAPYLVFVYVPGLLEKLLPKPFGWIGTALKKLSEFYGIKTKDIF